MKHKFLFFCFLLFTFNGFAQSKPRLVVGVVVDQMRWDFLYRYQNRYGADGFNRLLREGFSCENAFIPYTPTHTGAGHASVYTGSVPALNGIAGNTWYDKQLKRQVYCTEDASVNTVGSTSDAGKMSPRNLWSNTITDELRNASNYRNKTIAIALKDRGAILPGGHTATAAYWFDNESGGWISSSYYMKELPAWVKKLNEKRLPDDYLKQNWTTLYPLASYTQSAPDSSRYEGRLAGEDNSFPHLTAGIEKNKYEAFRNTPFANTYSFIMAKEAVVAERLGKSGETDFLALSLSTPDYIGHTFGPNSVEVEDCYLRLDRDLSDFLKFLDQQIGRGQYLFFLTTDHGVAQSPGYLLENRAFAGVYDHSGTEKLLKQELEKNFKAANIIEYSTNYQFYLNDSVIRAHRLDKKQVKQFIADFMMKQPAVSQVVDMSEPQASVPQKLLTMVGNSYNPKLSGDLLYILKPQYLQNWRTGSTHGAWNPYDTHIPLLWFGWKVRAGKSYRDVYMTDIAPTLAAMLQIQLPNASIGAVIEEVFLER